MARCPHCRHESSGRFFCDRCNSLLPMRVPEPLPASVRLPDGTTIDCSSWNGSWPSSEYPPHFRHSKGTPYRIYAFNRERWQLCSGAVNQRARVTLPTLASLTVVPVEEAAVVVARGLVDGRALLLERDPPGADPFIRLDAALFACRLLCQALTPLHQSGYVWPEFDPAGIVAVGDQVQITSLDLTLFPSGDHTLSIHPKPAYVAPEVSAREGVSPATDVFHVCAYLYYRLAGLLPGGFRGGGPVAFQHRFPDLRIFRPELPPGIKHVLQKGLSRDPAGRYSSLTELTSAFAESVDRAHQRKTCRTAIQIDVSGTSRIGLVHEYLGFPNQDNWGIHHPSPTTLLAIVADGVSLSNIGSGERASEIALARLGEILCKRLAITADVSRNFLTETFLEASRSILEAALHGNTQPIKDLGDLMSTTATVGIVQDRHLTLASVGDSRAYLISNGQAEQLTVDGDVGCHELAAGLPPEFLSKLGAEALSLYSCLGVAERNRTGQLVLSAERCRPSVTRWALIPGDIVLLCTDGLAEEGLFLSADDISRIVTESQPQTAANLVQRLVEAAHALRLPPSPKEPNGRGDDITCIVLVVKEV